MAAGEFSHELRVYIEDTDAGGIVYYVNYLKFMERARTEFMRALGFGKRDIFNLERMFVVRELAVKYQKPAQLDHELQATARVIELRGAVIVFQQCIRRGGELLADGQVTVACVDRTGKPRRLPADMAEALNAFQRELQQ